MRRRIAIAGIVVSLAACSPQQKQEARAISDDVKKDMQSAYDQTKEDLAFAADGLEQDAAQVRQNAESDAMRVANLVRDNTKKTVKRVREWLLTPPAEETRRAVALSYCYKSYQDVLCYPRPIPGWETRLVGYQGTGAEPPPPVVMRPLPTQAPNPAMKPESRVADAKPVFVGVPAEAKSDEAAKPASAPTSNDSSHETLPDPATSPQL